MILARTLKGKGRLVRRGKTAGRKPFKEATS